VFGNASTQTIQTPEQGRGKSMESPRSIIQSDGEEELVQLRWIKEGFKQGSKCGKRRRESDVEWERVPEFRCRESERSTASAGFHFWAGKLI